MRKAIILTAICLMTAGAPALYAQDYVPTPVTVSKEKVKLSGKLYYSHVVLEKQTLFSISKAYGVTVDDLYAANPSLIDKGLQKNSILLIPIKNQDLLEEEAPKTTSSGKVAVTPAPAQKEEVETPDYVEHIVKWYEDLNMIANKYGVSADDIVLYNRLPSKKVTRKQVLRIPLKPFDRSAYSTKEEAPEVPPVVEESKVEPKEEVVVPPVQEEKKVEETIPEQVTFTSKQTVQAALLLPLGASGKVNDT
ncbi:MAG: LysM peptidoglycan-binding domain-containing protein, partial [Bacteroidales bacterium]|nr:LysM peptidoglycan-binding domain-containing protein [Bacteroidales bacterium]